MFRGGNHRLTHVMTGGLATFAVEPQQLSGTFIGLAFQLNGSFGAVLEAVRGHVSRDVVRDPIQPDGLIDSLLSSAMTHRCMLSPLIASGMLLDCSALRRDVDVLLARWFVIIQIGCEMNMHVCGTHEVAG